jgi:hypothetical protein
MAGIIKPLPRNFVERPWGGTRIREFKGLCPLPDQIRIGGAGLGESFEIAAYDEDAEARAHPSLVALADGSTISLPRLLEREGRLLLGTEWMARHGCRIPLLPKILDIKELLSIQGHPPGHTEVYVIIDADPGATIRLGFKVDIDRKELGRELAAGRTAQLDLVGRLRRDVSLAALQRLLAPWFAHRNANADVVLPGLQPLLSESGHVAECAALLDSLKRIYWRVLDAMNVIPVTRGQVIHNANPPRIVRRSARAPAAEVHALGNPEGREVVALEIRRPGPTLRAWDNVRFPVRDVDIDAALDALNLAATTPDEFLVTPVDVPGRAHTRVSVDSQYFRLEHLVPPSGQHADVVSDTPHCLLNIGTRIELDTLDGRPLGHLARGESAFVPKTIGGYRVVSRDDGAHVVGVSLP